MRKLISIILVVSALLSACSSYTATDVEVAKYLASKKIIQDWSGDPKQYRFDEPIKRSEVISMALDMA